MSSHPISYVLRNPTCCEIKALSLYGSQKMSCLLDRDDWYVWRKNSGSFFDVRKYFGNVFSIVLDFNCTKYGYIYEIYIVEDIKISEIFSHSKLCNKLIKNFEEIKFK